jgi:hypothetical protein
MKISGILRKLNNIIPDEQNSWSNLNLKHKKQAKLKILMIFDIISSNLHYLLLFLAKNLFQLFLKDNDTINMLNDVLSFKQKCLVSPKQSEHLKILGEKFKITPLKERFSLIYPLKKACFKKKEAEDQLKVNVL